MPRKASHSHTCEAGKIPKRGILMSYIGDLLSLPNKLSAILRPGGWEISRSRKPALASCLIWLVFSVAGFAQVDRSSLAGTVRDASGALVPGTAVTVVQAATGLERKTDSNAAGVYVLEDLPTGNYRVVFEKSGFAKVVYESVEQVVGITRTLNPVLPVSSARDEVTVATAASELDQTSAAVSGSIEQTAIMELPLNGRNWASLTAMAPGAIDSGGSNQRTIRFMGRGRDDVNFLMDGVDATGIVNQAQKANVRLAVPTESISEFRVNSMLSPTEYGDATGAQMSVATMAGSNDFHGVGFDDVRNSAFAARSPLDRTPGPQPFRLNQFGGAVGGPIHKNKTFFYFDTEAIRQQLDQTDIGFVPTAAFRSQVLATSPVLAPIVNAFPIGNGTTTTPNVAQYTSTGNRSRMKRRLCSGSTIISTTGTPRSCDSTTIRRPLLRRWARY